MSIIVFYHLLYYKLFKFTSKTRSLEGAAIGSSFILGFILIIWLFDLLALLNKFNLVPKNMILPIFGISVGINILYFIRKKRYLRVISGIESRKIPMVFHIASYLLFAWTFIGIAFL